MHCNTWQRKQLMAHNTKRNGSIRSVTSRLTNYSVWLYVCSACVSVGHRESFFRARPCDCIHPLWPAPVGLARQNSRWTDDKLQNTLSIFAYTNYILTKSREGYCVLVYQISVQYETLVSILIIVANLNQKMNNILL